MRRAEELAKTGAALILSSCPACDLQLARMVKKIGANIRVMDLIRFLDDTLS
jgi:Fe-S oxidoreductase